MTADHCPGCRNVLAQWRTVIAIAGQPTAADVEISDDLTHNRIQSMFRGLRRR